MRASLILIIYAVLLFQCTTSENTPSWPDKNPKLEVIKISSGNSSNINTSAIFEEPELIKLETNDDNLMGDIVKLTPTKNHYFILCSNGLFIFKEDGSFVNKINRKINNTIQSYTDFQIDTTKNTITIYDNKARQFIETDFDGKTISSWWIDLDGYSSHKISDNLYAVYIGASYYNKRANHKLNFINKKGDITEKYFPISEHETTFMHFGDLNNFSYGSQSTKFLYSFNDTIYSITETKVRPEFYFDFGDERVPSSILQNHYKDVMHFYENLRSSNYSFRVNGFIEGENHIIFSYANGFNIIHGILSKKSKNLKLINQYTDDLVFDGYILKPDFLNLSRAYYQGRYYSLIDSHDFLKRTKEIKEKESFSELTETSAEIFEIAQETSVRDNPIIYRYFIKDF